MSRTNSGVNVFNPDDGIPSDASGGGAGGDSTAAAIAMARDQASQAQATIQNLKGSATTLPPGSAATVTVTGAGTSKVINVGVPRGEPGMGYAEGQQLLTQNAGTLAAAQSSAADADASRILAEQAQAAALEVPDANVSALIGNDATDTASAGDARWLKGTRDANNTIRALVNTNDTSAGAGQCIFIAAPSPTSPHTINGSTALLRLVLGGYDSVMGNALAATMIAPMHCTLDDTSTHGLIVGGSYQNLIGANYSAIIGGTKHTIGKTGQNTNYSAILGGNEHTVTAYYAGVMGGWRNIVTKQGAFIGGGYKNQAHNEWGLVSGYECVAGSEANTTWGQYTSVAGGYRNKIGVNASGRFSATVGGREHVVDVESAGVVGGKGAKPNFGGAQAWANGWQATVGDAQMERAVFRGRSTDSFAKQLLVDGAIRLVIPNNTTWAFEGSVVGRRASDGETGAWKVAGVISRGANAASTAIVGTPLVTPMGTTPGQASAWVVDVVADTTFGALSVRGRSPSGGTVNWVGGIDLTEVTA